MVSNSKGLQRPSSSTKYLNKASSNPCLAGKVSSFSLGLTISPRALSRFRPSYVLLLLYFVRSGR